MSLDLWKRMAEKGAALNSKKGGNPKKKKVFIVIGKVLKNVTKGQKGNEKK